MSASATLPIASIVWYLFPAKLTSVKPRALLEISRSRGELGVEVLALLTVYLQLQVVLNDP